MLLLAPARSYRDPQGHDDILKKYWHVLLFLFSGHLLFAISGLAYWASGPLVDLIQTYMKINCQTEYKIILFGNISSYRKWENQYAHKLCFRENVSISGVKTSFGEIVESCVGITSDPKKKSP